MLQYPAVLEPGQVTQFPQRWIDGGMVRNFEAALIEVGNHVQRAPARIPEHGNQLSTGERTQLRGFTGPCFRAVQRVDDTAKQPALLDWLPPGRGAIHIATYPPLRTSRI